MSKHLKIDYYKRGSYEAVTMTPIEGALQLSITSVEEGGVLTIDTTDEEEIFHWLKNRYELRHGCDLVSYNFDEDDE